VCRYPSPRPEITEDIIRRALKLCPELVPSHVRANRAASELTIDDVRPLVLEEGCGLRPARRGGIRLEVDWIPAGAASGAKVPIVFNYGYLSSHMLPDERLNAGRHGGYGFQSSWGSATIAVRLLEGALEKGEVAKDELNASAAPASTPDGIEARSW
jgi:D-amino-acid oxidase